MDSLRDIPVLHYQMPKNKKPEEEPYTPEQLENVLKIIPIIREIYADLIEAGVDYEYLSNLYDTDLKQALELAMAYNEREGPLTEDQRGWPNSAKMKDPTAMLKPSKQKFDENGKPIFKNRKK